jgi:hypothetical protein
MKPYLISFLVSKIKCNKKRKKKYKQFYFPTSQLTSENGYILKKKDNKAKRKRAGGKIFTLFSRDVSN